MKPHPRIRKTIKWTGAAVTVLLVVVWVGSGWYGGGWSNGKDFLIQAARGRIGVQGNTHAARVIHGWCRFDINPRFAGWRSLVSLPSFARDSTGGWYIEVSLSTVVAPVALITGCAWVMDGRARRRARQNLCPKCNYDRAGLAAGAKCPECGAMPVSA